MNFSMPAYIQVMEMRYSDNAHVWPTRLKPVIHSYRQAFWLLMHWKLSTDPQDWGHCILDYVEVNSSTIRTYLCFFPVTAIGFGNDIYVTTFVNVVGKECDVHINSIYQHSGCKAKITPQVRRRGKKALKEDLWEKPQKCMCMPNV